MEKIGAFIALLFKVAGFVCIQILVVRIVDRGYENLDRSIERSSSDPKSARGRVDILTLVAILFLLITVYSLNSDTGGAFGYIKNVVDVQATKVSLLFATDTPTPTQTLTNTPKPPQPPTGTPTPTATVTPIPTFTPIPSLTPTDQPKLMVFRTTEQELKTIPSIWIENNIDIAMKSGDYFQSHNISVSYLEKYRWPFIWCTLDNKLLDENLGVMRVDFIIDDKHVSQSDIYVYDTTSSFWNCNNWSVTLSHLKPGSQIDLRIELNIQEDIFDGENIYSPGTYIFELIASVE